MNHASSGESGGCRFSECPVYYSRNQSAGKFCLLIFSSKRITPHKPSIKCGDLRIQQDDRNSCAGQVRTK